MSVQIAELTAEHHHDGFGIFNSSPRLSWRFAATEVKEWRQTAYEVVIKRGADGREESYSVLSPDSILVPWPSFPLSSRERVSVRVRVTGTEGPPTPWASLTIEAALLHRSDWQASMVSGPAQPEDEPKKPFRVRKVFSLPRGRQRQRARLYATAFGIYQAEINGVVVGDQLLTPGWQSYHHRLHYQVYDVSHLLQDGENVIGAYIGEGWYAGRLGRPGTSNIWGSRPGFLCQLEVDGQIACVTDTSWEHLEGPVVHSEIYNGETFDSRLDDLSWCQYEGLFAQPGLGAVEQLPFPVAELSTSEAAPVRRVMVLKPQTLITTLTGKKVLDFGQNLVGWVRIESDLPGHGELVIRHAEVMEHGELGTRPLRTAKATARIKLGGSSVRGYEPRFTFYGFR
jgi:alpha-L-rhamnosidase